MGYQIHNTCTKFIFGYLLFSLFSSLLLGFFLATITNMKVAKINTWFWLFFLKTFTGIMALFFIKKIVNIKKVFFFF